MRPPYTARTQTYARARATANMLASVRILRIQKPDMDDLTLIVTAALSETVYDGVARITTVNPAGVLTVGEEQISTRSTNVSIPYDSSVPRVDDVVIVDSYGSDTDLGERAFQIKGVDGGGLLRAVRTLSCVVYTESRWWES